MAIPATNSGLGPHRRRSYPVPTAKPIETAHEDVVTDGDVDYEKLTKAELITLAKEADLPTTGTKAELIERITHPTEPAEAAAPEETTTPLAEGRADSEEN